MEHFDFGSSHFGIWIWDFGLTLLRIDKQRILECGEQEGFIAPQRRREQRKR
jgi:hypothetical protein